MSILQNIGIFLVDTAFTLYIYAVILRFVLAMSRADFYNPISQTIVTITNPVLIPLRRMIPAMGKIDTAAVVLALALIFTKRLLILLMQGTSVSFIGLVFYAIIELLRTVIWLYIIAIILQAVMSWFGNSYGNPFASILNSLVEPVLRPIRNVVPNIGMIDISPMIAILGLNILLIILDGLA